MTQAVERARQAARQRRKERFTALLRHVNPDTLRLAFYALKGKATAGVDGERWEDYEGDLELRLAALHARLHRGLRERRHAAIADQGQWPRQTGSGFFAYHAVPTNRQAVAAFRYHVLDLCGDRTVMRVPCTLRLVWRVRYLAKQQGKR
ncbi:MAG: hypothetical protein ACREFP_14080 [Acetobacteraceae bacterium]